MTTPAPPILICMRLADMRLVHPQQAAGRCARCGHTVGIYPSGQHVMRQFPNVEIVCQVCQQPEGIVQLAPGAEAEPFESKKKPPDRGGLADDVND